MSVLLWSFDVHNFYFLIIIFNILWTISFICSVGPFDTVKAFLCYAFYETIVWTVEKRLSITIRRVLLVSWDLLNQIRNRLTFLKCFSIFNKKSILSHAYLVKVLEKICIWISLCNSFFAFYSLVQYTQYFKVLMGL